MTATDEGAEAGGGDNGRYLDTWYGRLRDAYLATMADLGVHADMAAGRVPGGHGRLQRP